jgi:hypothetical protein
VIPTTTPLQMSCGLDNHMGAFGDGEWIAGLICTFADAGAMTLTAFGLVVWFTVSAMSYSRTQSLLMPMIYLLTLGSVALTMLPAVGLGVAAIVLLGGGAGITVLVLRRLDRI